jgi:hypothetical protein
VIDCEVDDGQVGLRDVLSGAVDHRMYIARTASARSSDISPRAAAIVSEES